MNLNGCWYSMALFPASHIIKYHFLVLLLKIIMEKNWKKNSFLFFFLYRNFLNKHYKILSNIKHFQSITWQSSFRQALHELPATQIMIAEDLLLKQRRYI